LSKDEVEVGDVEPQHEGLELAGPANIDTGAEISADLRGEAGKPIEAISVLRLYMCMYTYTRVCVCVHTHVCIVWCVRAQADIEYLDKADEDLQLVREVGLHLRRAVDGQNVLIVRLQEGRLSVITS